MGGGTLLAAALRNGVPKGVPPSQLASVEVNTVSVLRGSRCRRSWANNKTLEEGNSKTLEEGQRRVGLGVSG